jgi:hypothetical protein
LIRAQEDVPSNLVDLQLFYEIREFHTPILTEAGVPRAVLSEGRRLV